MIKIKRKLGINVLEAARQRIAWTFDTFRYIYVSFSGGKDSTVMLHLVMDEAIKRNRKVGILFIDLEGQYKLTIDHVKECIKLYEDHIELYWICLPLILRNAVSMYQPRWICWDSDVKDLWIRDIPEEAIFDESYFPFFKKGMEFEEFIGFFGDWYGKGDPTACFVGIRSDESLNRFRALAMERGSKFEGKCYTTWKGNGVFNVYPIYDWRTQDDWIYLQKYNKPYNKLYDRMHQAGLTIHQMRICQPYGDDQRKGLWLFHVIEPETWAKIVLRVNGANQGARYAKESGNILGNYKITKPEHHTWESYSKLLLASMPEKTREHYKNKIAVFLKWWENNGYPQGIPDDGIIEKGHANWKRIAKVLLRGDYWCKGLSFGQTKAEAYDKYLKLMKKKRDEWEII